MTQTVQTTKFVLETFIQTTPEILWKALTDGDYTEKYYFGSRVKSDWRVSSEFLYPNPAGGSFVEGKVLEIDQLKKLKTTFTPLWIPKAHGGGTESEVTWLIEQNGEACKLTLIHERLDPDAPITANLKSGWAQILSGLKTYLETGKPLIMACEQ